MVVVAVEIVVVVKMGCRYACARSTRGVKVDVGTTKGAGYVIYRKQDGVLCWCACAVYAGYNGGEWMVSDGVNTLPGRK